jgi:hypothetical protein
MIRCETFLRAPFPRVGQRLIETPETRSLISNNSIRTLLSLNGDNTVHHNLLPENIVAITKTVTVKDEMGREATSTQTFLVSIQDYFTLHRQDDIRVFGPHFLVPLKDKPKSLKPLRVETK